MKILEWILPKKKNNIVIPVAQEGTLSGMALIKAFTTEDEPKVKDFPKDKYKFYWEIILKNKSPGQYSASVRFYDYSGNIQHQIEYINSDVKKLKALVSEEILSIMNSNKR